LKMNKRKYSKSLVLLLSLALVLTVSVGGSLAYLHTQSNSVQNSFQVGKVEVTVVPSGNAYVVKNSDEDNSVSVCIRAAVVANWSSGAGVYWKNPQVAISGTGWTKGTDGYYYYSGSVAKGGQTSELSVTLASGEQAPDNTYTLQVQVLAEAIQSEPAAAVNQAWPGKP